MSAGDDNVFARWSRRKQAVRTSETASPYEEERVGDAVAPEADIEPAEPLDQQLAAVELDGAQPEETEPAEPLPRLEDLTAESDLSAFLRKGVPKALKKAAMRKMWSLDPAIRDYIGPSEYAWDFNTPGSMAGFGPLDDAGEHVAEFLSTMSGGMRAAWREAAEVPEVPPTPPLRQIAIVEPDQDVSASPDDMADAGAREGSHELPQVTSDLQSRSLDQAANDAEPAAAEPAESSSPPATPRHGGAMPR